MGHDQQQRIGKSGTSTKAREQAMRGMLDFLEKAGLVKKEDASATRLPEASDAMGVEPAVTPAPTRVDGAASTGAPLDLDTIYAHAGIVASVYPAERLLRLVDGLSAMDEATRLMAIRAMDAADESWTIDDPLADAAAKVSALAQHAEQLQLNLQQQTRETQTRLAEVSARQDKVVGDIRQQMAELDALANREIARSAQETAAQEASLHTATQQTTREMAEVAQVSQRLQSLAAQFGAPATASKE